MEAGKEAAAGIAAWAGCVDGSAVISPRLLAQDVGPYLVTLVQYPGYGACVLLMYEVGHLFTVNAGARPNTVTGTQHFGQRDTLD